MARKKIESATGGLTNSVAAKVAELEREIELCGANRILSGMGRCANIDVAVFYARRATDLRIRRSRLLYAKGAKSSL